MAKQKTPAPKRKKCGLDKALEDVKAGRVFFAKDAEDVMRQCLGR